MGSCKCECECEYQWVIEKGKIKHVLLGIIHVVLLKTLQHILSKNVQMRWPVILDIVVPRHAIYHTKLQVLFLVVPIMPWGPIASHRIILFYHWATVQDSAH